jgi:DNA topoisomerase-2
MSYESDFSEDFSDASSFDASCGSAKIPVFVQPAKKAAPVAKKAPVKKKKAAPAEKENAKEEASSPMAKGKTKNAVGKSQTIEEAYQKLTQLQHVLKRPDTYIGSTKLQEQEMWVWNGLMEKMELKKVEFPPGLYKIFDEIIVNAADNAQRSSGTNRMKNIKVSIDQARGEFKCWNDGQGIPIDFHKKEKMYVPEMIFGELLTGSNFNDDQAKVTGGRNGFGAKLTNIFSTEFTIECHDSSRGKRYVQTWSGNMGSKAEPKITSDSRKTDFVEVRFRPDLKRFGLDHISDDLIALFSKRVYDIAGCNPALNVHLNGEKIKVKSFKDYVSLYPLDTKEDGKPFALVYETPHERWEVAATVSTSGTFHQVSFVNSIATYDGGSHVTHVTDAIAKALEEKLNKKGQKSAPISKAVIKQHLWVFIRCLVENPSFASQTKEKMTSKVSEFGSRCKLDDAFFTKLSKGGIKDYVLRFANFKAQKSLKGKGGKKVDRLRGIEKLDDANFAGTKQGKDCTLIVTEGDSAKTLAVCGLSVVGRDYFGVFPLRGKPLNVRGAKVSDLIKNKEISNLVKIIGLKFGHKYETVDSLRYGKLMIMADQDVDGSHIKGLVLNFIDVHWPELLRLGFCIEFITPIIKAKKGKQSISFYTLPEYETWKESPDSKGWTIKYYKGLGTSERDEAREYFSDLKKHRIAFKYRGEMDRKTMELAFHKEKASDRKEWISNADPKDFLKTSSGSVYIADFINKEMVHFSVESVHRAIPHVLDGMKPSHRKVLFGCFKRNLIKPIKVAQLAGYVSEKAAYHHGEQSLQSTIIGMAQNFVGKNNINLLYPEGQFGSRLLGGDDASAARYIFTKLAPITRKIFNVQDDALLNYLEDDGFPVEPDFYVPILPMILVNGASGIGTGWSTNIPNFNPREIVANLRRLLRGEEVEEMHPWFMGFKGTITKKNWAVKSTANQYEVKGIYEIDGNEVNITELPVYGWTQNYKDFIEENLVDAPTPKGVFIEDYKEYHTDTFVDFNVVMNETKLRELQKARTFEKTMKLVSTMSVSNLMAVGVDGKIKKYANVGEILKEFYKVRLDYYSKRKEHLSTLLNEEWEILDNKVRFIEAVIADSCKVRGKSKKLVNTELQRCGFKKFCLKKKKNNNSNDDEADFDEEEMFGDADSKDKENDVTYDYLLRMPIYSLTKEKADNLRKQRDAKRAELDEILAAHPKQLWMTDLDELMEAYDEFEEEMVGQSSASTSTRGLKHKSRTNKKGSKKVTKPKYDSLLEVSKKPATKKKAAAAATAVSAPAPAPAPAKKAAPAPKKKVAVVEKDPGNFLDTSNYGLSDDEFDDDEELNASDLELLGLDEDDMMNYSAQKPAKKVTAPVAKKKVTKRAQMDDLDDEFGMELDDEQPAKKKISPPKPEPKKRAAPKKKKQQLSDDEDDELDLLDSEVIEKPKTRRKAAPKSYVISDDDEDELDLESDMELESDEEDEMDLESDFDEDF